jgi:hypothetical protein
MQKKNQHHGTAFGEGEEVPYQGLEEEVVVVVQRSLYFQLLVVALVREFDLEQKAESCQESREEFYLGLQERIARESVVQFFPGSAVL